MRSNGGIVTIQKYQKLLGTPVMQTKQYGDKR